MSKKVFTPEEAEMLRENKYTFAVTPHILSFTKEFKEIFWEEYQSGAVPRQILEQYGYSWEEKVTLLTGGEERPAQDGRIKIKRNGLRVVDRKNTGKIRADAYVMELRDGKSAARNGNAAASERTGTTQSGRTNGGAQSGNARYGRIEGTIRNRNR